MSEENAINIDSLLDGTLDDIEDLPSFAPFPAGVHRAKATLSLKDIGGKRAAELALVGMETEELANPTSDEPIKAGDACSTIFFLDNKYAVDALKKIAAPLGEALELATLKDIIEQTTDIECLVVTSIRVDKNDTEKKYLNVKTLAVL